MKKKVPNVWTEDQIAILTGNYQKFSRKRLAELTNQTDNNVRNKLVELGLVNKEKRKSYKVESTKNTLQWLEEEIEYLKLNFDRISLEDLINNLRFSKATILRKAKQLNLNKPKKRIKKDSFNYYELEILIDNYDIKTLDELQKLIPSKTQSQILRKARSIGFSTKKRTIPEKIVENILSRLKVDYISESKVEGSNFINDFIVNNLIIEVQGDYWHGNPKFYKQLNSVQQKMVDRDFRKKEELENLGYKMLYIWENDLKTNLEECERIISLHCSDVK